MGCWPVNSLESMGRSPCPRVARAHRAAGWALPLLCITLVVCASMLTLTMPGLLAHFSRDIDKLWQQAQAQVLAQAGLERALGLLAVPDPLDSQCRRARIGDKTSPGPGWTLAEAGGWMRCSVDLVAAAGPKAWRCTCALLPQDARHTPPAPADPSALAFSVDAQFQPDSPTQVRLGVTAGALVAGAGGADVHRIGLIVRRDSDSHWRAVIGSWTDQP